MRKPFYGWIIVGTTFLIGITEVGAFQNILSIFMKPMALDFGWNRASVAGAIAFGSLCAGMLSPFVGPFLDRHGPRKVAFGGILILSAGLVGMSFLRHIWQLYLFFGVGRMIAIGLLGLVISVSVSNWFIRYRGRAMGIAMLGPCFGSVILPALTQFLILSHGWRMTWGALGTVVFIMSGIPTLLFLHRRPEDIGLLPDGELQVFPKNGLCDSSANSELESFEEISEPVWTRAQATRTKAFWLLTFLHSLIPFLQAGINFHIFPFLTDKGFNEVSAVLVLSIIAVFGALGSFVWGLFAERFNIKSLLAVNIFSNGLVFLLLFWAVEFKVANILGTGIVFFLAALHGLLQGGRNPVLSIIWAVFFGRKFLGSIFGFSSMFRHTANAMGPVFAALCFDLLGSYTFPFSLFVAIFLISGMISLFMKPPLPLKSNG
ncbi:MFS transporter [Thermodesulfobacteriota bacterium]